MTSADLSALALDSLASLLRVLGGVALALVSGVALGFIRSSLPPALKRNRLLAFLFEAPKFPPPIAWIPFVILLFGIGEWSAVVIVFIGAFSPIFTQTYEGAESIPPALRRTAASFGFRGLARLRHLLLPGALPYVLSGLKSGLSMGWMSVIAAEMISGQTGLGYSIQLYRLNLRYEMIAVDLVVIGLIGYLLVAMVGRLENVLIPWHERVAGK